MADFLGAQNLLLLALLTPKSKKIFSYCLTFKMIVFLGAQNFL
jgi:hypothetical protein